jgi:vitamin B12 transporter
MGLLVPAVAIPAGARAETPIVVTATRTAIPVAADTAGTIVIDRDEIAASGARDLVDLLRFHAGLDLGRNGGPGQTTSLFIRGAESNHTLVLLDGVRINPGTLGVPPLQLIDPKLVERIEIVKGPHSTLYGSDAVGGVVQIFTRGGADAPARAHAALGYGSQNTRSLSAGASGASGDYFASINLSGVDSDGFPARREASRDSGHRNTSLALRAGHHGDRISTELSHVEFRGNTEYFDFFLAPLDEDHRNAVTALTLRGPLGDASASTLRISHMEDRINQKQSDDFATTRRNVIDWQNDWQVTSNLLLTTGVVLSRQDTAALSFGTRLAETLDEKSVYAQLQATRDRHHWLAAMRWLDHDAFGSHVTWDLSYAFTVTPALSFSAAAATGFRAPDSSDRFGFGGNPDLDPETSRGVELALRYRPAPGHSISVGAFHTDLDDLINFYDPDGFLGPVAGRNENVDRARIQGIELRYERRNGPWRGAIEFALQDPVNRDTGRQLARRAERSASVQLGYTRERYRAGVNALASSSRPDSDFSNTVNAGYTVVDLYGGLRLAPGWWLQGRIDNLFDRDYVLADGFNTQPRALFVELLWNGAARK